MILDQFHRTMRILPCAASNSRTVMLGMIPVMYVLYVCFIHKFMTDRRLC